MSFCSHSPDWWSKKFSLQPASVFSEFLLYSCRCNSAPALDHDIFLVDFKIKWFSERTASVWQMSTGIQNHLWYVSLHRLVFRLWYSESLWRNERTKVPEKIKHIQLVFVYQIYDWFMIHTISSRITSQEKIWAAMNPLKAYIKPI